MDTNNNSTNDNNSIIIDVDDKDGRIEVTPSHSEGNNSVFLF